MPEASSLRLIRALAAGGWLVVLGLLLHSPVGLTQDSDSETTDPFTVTIQNTVRIDITTHPGDKTVTRADLLNRYFPLDDIVYEVYAVTDYQVTVCKTTTQTAGPLTVIDTDRILETRVQDGAAGFSPYPDDGADDPVSDIPNFSSGSVEDTAPDIPEGCTSPKNLFHGGNTEGGSDNKVTVTQNLQLDLDALLDNAAGNVYQFTITLTINET
jgi:hypothetical protein